MKADNENEEAAVALKYKMSAEDLLGTNDPVIHRAVGQKAETIREFAVARPMDDEDDDAEEQQQNKDVTTGPMSSLHKEESHSHNSSEWKTDDSEATTPKAKSNRKTTTLEPYL